MCMYAEHHVPVHDKPDLPQHCKVLTKKAVRLMPKLDQTGPLHCTDLTAFT